MPNTTSADGTPIGYDTAGSGPVLVLVDGAMCYRGGPLASLALSSSKNRYWSRAFWRLSASQ